MRVLVAGASGFIGAELVDHLTAGGHDVVRLVRRRALSPDEASWSPAAGIIDFTLMDRVDAVVNLAGASLARIPWTKGYRREILDSRVSTTRTLADAMRKARRPPSTFISASAVGYYGDRPGELITEYSSAGTGFLAGVVEKWEAAARLAPDETRTVTVRSGIVVGHGHGHSHGGSLKRVAAFTRLGVSARLGTGGQHWPWIALADEVGAIAHLLDSDVSGPVNLAGPTPATADRVMTAMAERMRRPHVFSVSEKLLGLVLGQAAEELLLSSQKVRPQRLIDDGYRFEHATVETALDAMLGR
ncbi:TIGR01777 family oxidoreductase [Agromyces sp. SYSU K20354]|uniref:TIGR01777 family oxidoreductase n=1 Tax=Agromyces cavernae TaxID=2898659 RepID=UPI001E3F1CA8|nr:TIGR01777 family oxidoreductase [Agromyces cavernae]MCD2443777.1 TIGR01777 family oxidoreductase [Agromyces cavernae]